MRFLIDAQLPPGLCGWRASRGHFAVHVTEVLAGNASDAMLAEWAEREAAIILSKDEDFLVLQRGHAFRLVWLRCGNTTNSALAQWLDARWARAVQLLNIGEATIELR